jgi:hypothetical protein
MRQLTTILLLIVTCWTGSVLATSDVLSPAVGEVTFTLGKPYLSHGSDERELIKVGAVVRVNDVIETGTGSQVHIRFVDNALVSVRPSSTLEIVRYDYDAKNPKNSAVKLNLVEGVTRAISGEAAKNARQNFRLNTPIAAIGVRGTDFAVSADKDSVRAIVNEGLIVVAPFSSDCSAESLGPCSQDAVELSGLSRQILEMNANTAGVSASLLPATNAQAQALAVEEASAADATEKKSAKNSDSKELYTDTVTSRTVNTTLASKPESVKPIEAPVQAPIEVAIAPKPEFTPDTAQTAQTLTTNSQLVWGRWIERNLDSERITVPYEVAIANNRQATIGNVAHALFRVEPAGKSLQPGLGVLAFNLTMAQAQYRSGGKVELMDVNGGQLNLDFNQGLFSTSLQLNHAATGNVTFEDSGRIYTDIFRSVSDTQSMAGTISLDGKEAGYFFEKSLQNGSVEGLTLWSQKP